MSDEGIHFLRDCLRELIVWHDEQAAHDRRFEAIERKVYDRLGIHPSPRSRIRPTGERLLTLYNRLGEAIDGSMERLDGRPRL